MTELQVHRSAPHPVQASTGHEPQATRTRRAPDGATGVARTPGSTRLVARHLSRTTSVAPSAPNPTQIQKRLETYFGQMSGPYTVNGKSVEVPAGFRMRDGMNQVDTGPYPHDHDVKVYRKRIEKALGADAYRKVAADVGMVVIGKGTAKQVQRVTQALIDSPAFKPYAKLPAETAIRRMAWDYGVGMDCSGYVHSAFLYSRGSGDRAASAARYDLGTPDNSGLQHPLAHGFRKVPPAQARPGDYIKLSHGADGTGHKLIVMANDVLDDPVRAEVSSSLGSKPGARVHIITVASSWGAGGDPDNGGVMQKMWAYDESSGRWADVVKLSSGHLFVGPSSTTGPYEHQLDGVFRPRTEK